MKIIHDPESGAIYIRLRDRPIVETEELTPGVLVDLAEDGLPVGLDVLDAALIGQLQKSQQATSTP